MMKYLGLLLWVLMPSVGVANQDGLIRIGIPLYITVPGGGLTPCKVDFEDFIAFAQAFGSTSNDQRFNSRADTNQDGIVNFSDFIAFAGVFGLSGVSGDCSPRHQILGQIMQQAKPLANVWVDILEAPTTGLFTNKVTQTDTLGRFISSGLGRGDYTVVPKKFGYQFMPDTVRVVIDSASVTLPPIESVMQFGVVDVKVVQDSMPVADVEVMFSQSENELNQWAGMTDPSGVLAIRISVVDEKVGITGLYDATVMRVSTGEILGRWKDISIVSENKQRLILDIGKVAYYIPEREYNYFHNGEKVSLTPSEEYVTVQFKENVSGADRDTLMNFIGLENGRTYSFTPEFRVKDKRGYHVMLDVLYWLRKSGLIDFANPSFNEGRYYKTPTDEVWVHFYSDVTLGDIALFASEMGATVGRPGNDNSYILKVHDLLSRDVFEISKQYHNHPLVERIEPYMLTSQVVVN